MTAVTVFLGAGGGAGTTSAALAMARRLAGSGLARRGLAGRVLLVDLDVWSGTLAQRLGLAPTVSLADLAAVELVDIDHDAVTAVSWRTDDGLELIPAPARPELADVVDPQLVDAVLQLLITGDHYDAIVIDGGSRLDLSIWRACMRADRLVICSRRSATGQAQVDNLLDVLARSGYTAPIELRRRTSLVSYQIQQLAQRARFGLQRRSTRAGSPARTALPVATSTSSMRGT